MRCLSGSGQTTKLRLGRNSQPGIHTAREHVSKIPSNMGFLRA